MYTIGNIRGYHPFFLIVATLAMLGECAFYAACMVHNGVADVITSCAFLCTVVLVIVNIGHCYGTAFDEANIPLSRDVEIDEIYLVGVSFLRVVGIEAFHKAQVRKAVELGKRRLDAKISMLTMKDATVGKCLREALTVHFLPGMVPTVISAMVSVYRNYNRGEFALSALALATVYSRLVVGLILVETAFFVRLAQALSMFEIRRVEADIRTVAPSMVSPRTQTQLL